MSTQRQSRESTSRKILFGIAMALLGAVITHYAMNYVKAGNPVIEIISIKMLPNERSIVASSKAIELSRSSRWIESLEEGRSYSVNELKDYHSRLDDQNRKVDRLISAIESVDGTNKLTENVGARLMSTMYASLIGEINRGELVLSIGDISLSDAPDMSELRFLPDPEIYQHLSRFIESAETDHGERAQTKRRIISHLLAASKAELENDLALLTEVGNLSESAGTGQKRASVTTSIINDGQSSITIDDNMMMSIVGIEAMPLLQWGDGSVPGITLSPNEAIIANFVMTKEMTEEDYNTVLSKISDNSLHATYVVKIMSGPARGRQWIRGKLDPSILNNNKVIEEYKAQLL